MPYRAAPKLSAELAADEQRHDAQCAGGKNFYTPYLKSPPEVRVAQNQKCAQVLPGVIQAMKEHVREFGPGGNPDRSGFTH